MIDLDCEGKKGNKFSVKKKKNPIVFREKENEKKKKKLIRIFNNARMIPKIFSDRSQREKKGERRRERASARQWRRAVAQILSL